MISNSQKTLIQSNMLFLILFLFGMGYNFQFSYGGGCEMTRKCAITLDEKNADLAFIDEIDAVERSWQEEIPSHLLLVGGLDWRGWAYICKDQNDPDDIFTGEYRDSVILYKGKFRYKHPQKKPIPENIFDEYYMSHLSGDGILFREINQPRKDFFFMEMMESELIKRLNAD